MHYRSISYQWLLTSVLPILSTAFQWNHWLSHQTLKGSGFSGNVRWFRFDWVPLLQGFWVSSIWTLLTRFLHTHLQIGLSQPSPTRKMVQHLQSVRSRCPLILWIGSKNRMSRESGYVQMTANTKKKARQVKCRREFTSKPLKFLWSHKCQFSSVRGLWRKTKRWPCPVWWRRGWGSRSSSYF